MFSPLPPPAEKSLAEEEQGCAGDPEVGGVGLAGPRKGRGPLGGSSEGPSPWTGCLPAPESCLSSVWHWGAGGHPSPTPGARVGLGPAGLDQQQEGPPHRLLAGPPPPQSRLRALQAPRAGGRALQHPRSAVPPDLSLWGSGYAAPLATSRHCFGFWGGSSWSGTWVWPGGCPQPSHGLCPPGPPQLFAPPEPWRVRKTQPRTVCFLGASLSPSLMPLQLPFWGYRRVTPCNQRKPRADDGREASWRRRQAWRDGAHPGPVWSPHSAQQQACVRATLDGSERLQTRRGALCEPEGLEVIHGGAGAAEWVRAVSVAGQWSPPASAWCWPWDFLIWGTQEGWEAAAGSAL